MRTEGDLEVGRGCRADSCRGILRWPFDTELESFTLSSVEEMGGMEGVRGN